MIRRTVTAAVLNGGILLLVLALLMLGFVSWYRKEEEVA